MSPHSFVIHGSTIEFGLIQHTLCPLTRTQLCLGFLVGNLQSCFSCNLSCFFCALRVTAALPFLDSHLFHSLEEKRRQLWLTLPPALPLFLLYWLDQLLVWLHQIFRAESIFSSTASTKMSYQNCKFLSPSSLFCCLNFFLTLLKFKQFLVNGTAKPTFAHGHIFFSFAKFLIKRSVSGKVFGPAIDNSCHIVKVKVQDSRWMFITIHSCKASDPLLVLHHLLSACTHWGLEWTMQSIHFMLNTSRIWLPMMMMSPCL